MSDCKGWANIPFQKIELIERDTADKFTLGEKRDTYLNTERAYNCIEERWCERFFLFQIKFLIIIRVQLYILSPKFEEKAYLDLPSNNSVAKEIMYQTVL